MQRKVLKRTMNQVVVLSLRVCVLCVSPATIWINSCPHLSLLSGAGGGRKGIKTDATSQSRAPTRGEKDERLYLDLTSRARACLSVCKCV